jgi:hypothetical protein
MSKKTKYKLLKDIPGYKAGSIVTIIDGETLFYTCGSGYRISEKIIKNHPEWFEEVVDWPKKWENVKLASNGFDTIGWTDRLSIFSHHPSYKSILARLKLEAIAKQMNDGRVPDWTDSKSKYFVYYHNEKLVISSARGTKELIVFKTREMAEFSLEHHRELWEDYWMINE